MLRKMLCLLLLLLLLAAPAAQAGFSEIPDRAVFSLGYDRLQRAIAREKPVRWSARIEPRAMDGIADESMGVAAAIVSALDLSGVVQCFKEGGYLEARVSAGGEPILSIGQISRDGRIGLDLGGQWLSMKQDMLAESAAMLELDEFMTSLADFDYSGIRAGDTPFVTPLYKAGITLWSLASPYSEDSNRLSVSSGATSHGMAYELDTAAVREVLLAWADTFDAAGFQLGFAGTDMSVSLGGDVIDGLAQKVRDFAQAVEAAKPLTFTTAFGEGDILRRAKGGGTIAHAGKRTGVSYSYSCDLSSTRITRKFSLDMQPKDADTIVLSCTALTSSNNKSSGANELTLSASGVWDGEPYRLKIDIKELNKYAVVDDVLEETITGTISGSLKYAGEVVAEVMIHRQGRTASTTRLTGPVSIEDVYDVDIVRGEATLFSGVVTLAYEVDDGPAPQESVLDSARRLEEMDFMAMETLRESLRDAAAQARQALIVTLPVNTLGALLGAP